MAITVIHESTNELLWRDVRELVVGKEQLGAMCPTLSVSPFVESVAALELTRVLSGSAQTYNPPVNKSILPIHTGIYS